MNDSPSSLPLPPRVIHDFIRKVVEVNCGAVRSFKIDPHWRSHVFTALAEAFLREAHFDLTDQLADHIQAEASLPEPPHSERKPQTP